MAELNLETREDEDLMLFKEHLEKFCDSHPELAEKINNGYATKVKDEEGEHDVVCKKNLFGCYEYCSRKAIEIFEKRQKEKPEAYKEKRGGAIRSDIVFSWVVTYFEEDDIVPDKRNDHEELFNMDGTKFVAFMKKPAVQKLVKDVAMRASGLKKGNGNEQVSLDTLGAQPEATSKATKKKASGEQIGFDFSSLFGLGTEEGND